MKSDLLELRILPLSALRILGIPHVLAQVVRYNAEATFLFDE